MVIADGRVSQSFWRLGAGQTKNNAHPNWAVDRPPARCSGAWWVLYLPPRRGDRERSKGTRYVEKMEVKAVAFHDQVTLTAEIEHIWNKARAARDCARAITMTTSSVYLANMRLRGATFADARTG